MNILTEHWAAILSVIGGVIGYLFGLRKQQAEVQKIKTEVKGDELGNVSDALAIYRGMLKDLKDKLDDLNASYVELEAKFNLAQIKVQDYERKIKALEEENLYFMRKVKTCDFNHCQLKKNI